MPVTQQQLSYLKAMGIPVWVSRDAVDVSLFERQREKADTSEKLAIAQQSHASPSRTPTSPHVKSFSSEHLLDTIDQAVSAQLAISDVKTDSALPSASPIEKHIEDYSSLDWSALQSAVTACQQCELHRTRTQTVFGEGVKNAAWMMIGDAPKEEEDLQGAPFVAKSGILLNNMLAAVGLDRSTVYLTNVVKCRPPNNRDPKRDEMQACNAYLMRQIEVVKPSVIVVVGRIATQHLLQTSEPLARLRGRVHHLAGLNIPVVVTYHPAYLLRQPRDKQKSWEDLKLAHSLLGEQS